jgi:hypothetical protein
MPPAVRQYILENPPVLEDLIRETETHGYSGFRQHPELLLQRAGLDPSRFDLDAFRNRRVPPSADGLAGFLSRFLTALAVEPIDESQLTADDWLAIRRLQELGNFSEERVIRVYVMALRNEALAASLLLDTHAGRSGD